MQGRFRKEREKEVIGWGLTNRYIVGLYGQKDFENGFERKLHL